MVALMIETLSVGVLPKMEKMLGCPMVCSQVSSAVVLKVSGISLFPHMSPLQMIEPHKLRCPDSLNILGATFSPPYPRRLSKQKLIASGLSSGVPVTLCTDGGNAAINQEDTLSSVDTELAEIQDSPPPHAQSRTEFLSNVKFLSEVDEQEKIVYEDKKNEGIISNTTDAAAVVSYPSKKHGIVLLNKTKEIGVACWKTAPPWYKWPAVTFVVWILCMRVVFGQIVVSDLTPLWIIGPVVLSVLTWIGIQMANAMKEASMNAVSTGKVIIVRSSELLEYSKTGNWVEDSKSLAKNLVILADSKRKGFLTMSVRNMDRMMQYVQSGQLIKDVMQACIKMVVNRIEKVKSRYELKYTNFMKWWSPLKRNIVKYVVSFF